MERQQQNNIFFQQFTKRPEVSLLETKSVCSRVLTEEISVKEEQNFYDAWKESSGMRFCFNMSLDSSAKITESTQITCFEEMAPHPGFFNQLLRFLEDGAPSK